jgi:transposase
VECVEERYTIFGGIDWADTSHQVCVTNSTGDRVAERTVEHTGVAVSEMADWLVGLSGGDPAAVAVAIETPRGAIVETLLERGCHVFAINPKQLDRFRDRFSPAGAKDDRRDAQVLSSAVRTDRAALRRLSVDEPLTLQLREYARQDIELGEDLQRLANRLRDHLVRTWPELLQLSPAANERWFWALLQLVPTADHARHVRPAQVRQLLRTHRIRRVAADEVLAILRAPSVRLAPGVRDGVRVRILDLVEQLPVLDRQRRAAEARLEATLAAITTAAEGQSVREHQDITILQSLPALGTRIAATMLAEAARPLRQRDYHGLRVLSGIAPVTKRSGKSHVVTMRYACNGHLQRAVYLWARGCLHRDAHSHAHYARLRAAGHSHHRALRGVADRLLAVLIAMLEQGTLYDNSRRGQRAVVSVSA